MSTIRGEHDRHGTRATTRERQAPPDSARRPYASARVPREAALLGAVAIALLSALFADWGTYTGPLAAIAPRLPGTAPPWRLTPANPSLLMATALLTAVPLLYAEAARLRRRDPAWRIAFRGWSAVALAWLVAGTAAELLRLPFGTGPAQPVAEALWAALAQGAYGGLYGLALGWPVGLSLIPLVRLRAVDPTPGHPVLSSATSPGGAPSDRLPPAGPSWRGSPRGTRRAPYVWLTLGLLPGPLAYAGLGPMLASAAVPAACSATGCMPAHDGAIFFGEIVLRLLLPVWAAATLGLVALRRARRVRVLHSVLQLLLGLGCGGMAFLLSGMLGG